MTARALTLAFLITTLAVHAADRDRLTTDGKKWYDAVRPTEKEQLWKQIPWLLDLDEGLKQAKEEKRPLVLWVSGDDPLDRC